MRPLGRPSALPVTVPASPSAFDAVPLFRRTRRVHSVPAYPGRNSNRRRPTAVTFRAKQARPQDLSTLHGLPPATFPAGYTHENSTTAPASAGELNYFVNETQAASAQPGPALRMRRVSRRASNPYCLQICSQVRAPSMLMRSSGISRSCISRFTANHSSGSIMPRRHKSRRR